MSEEYFFKHHQKTSEDSKEANVEIPDNEKEEDIKLFLEVLGAADLKTIQLILLCQTSVSHFSIATSPNNPLPTILGYTCCPPEQHICGESHHTQCYPQHQGPHHACCVIANVANLGVAPSAYKKMCQAGYIWVEWKKKCMRRN